MTDGNETDDATHLQIIHKLDKESAVLREHIQQTKLDVANLRIERKEDILVLRSAITDLTAKVEVNSKAVQAFIVESARSSGAQKVINGLLGAAGGAAITAAITLFKRGGT